MNERLLKDIKKIFKRYMNEEDIESFKELAKKTGIDYQTLLDHLARPELFRIFELRALNDVLHFSSEDLLFLVSWEN